VSSTSEAFDGNAAALLHECLLSGESNSILLDNCGSELDRPFQVRCRNAAR
jgi:hypothetical protein